MSDNDTKPNEEILSEQKNGLSEEQVKTLCHKIRQRGKKVRFRRALTNNMRTKTKFATRLSLEWHVYTSTGDLDLTVDVVVGSETMRSDWGKKKVREEVEKKKNEFEWTGPDENELNEKSGDNNGKKEYTPQSLDSYQVNQYQSNPFKGSDPDIDTNGLR